MEILLKFLEKNGLVVAVLVVGLMILVADNVSKRLLNKKVPTPAVAIVFGLLLAYVGGTISGGEKGIADVKLFSGMGQLGGSMFRDFAIVSTAFGASILLMRKSGIVGAISLIIGIIVAFSVGLSVAWVMGYHDAVSLTTIGAGACTYIVGPVTGAAANTSGSFGGSILPTQPYYGFGNYGYGFGNYGYGVGRGNCGNNGNIGFPVGGGFGGRRGRCR